MMQLVVDCNQHVCSAHYL